MDIIDGLFILVFVTILVVPITWTLFDDVKKRRK